MLKLTSFRTLFKYKAISRPQTRQRDFQKDYTCNPSNFFQRVELVGNCETKSYANPRRLYAFTQSSKCSTKCEMRSGTRVIALLKIFIRRFTPFASSKERMLISPKELCFITTTKSASLWRYRVQKSSSKEEIRLRVVETPMNDSDQ